MIELTSNFVVEELTVNFFAIKCCRWSIAKLGELASSLILSTQGSALAPSGFNIRGGMNSYHIDKFSQYCGFTLLVSFIVFTSFSLIVCSILIESETMERDTWSYIFLRLLMSQTLSELLSQRKTIFSKNLSLIKFLANSLVVQLILINFTGLF